MASEDIAICAADLDSIPRLFKRTQCLQRFAAPAMFLWSSVSQAVRSGDEPRRLHASA